MSNLAATMTAPTPTGQATPTTNISPTFPLTVTEAPEGIPATSLGVLHADADLSTVVFPPSPSLRTEYEIAHEVLQALGKDANVRGRSRHTVTETGLVSQWLTAHRTQLLVLTACQRTNPKLLDALVNWCAASPTALLLAVDHGFATQTVAALKQQAPVVIPWPNTPQGQAQTVTAPAQVAGMELWPLPNDHYFTFLAACRRHLLPATYRDVYALYADTHRRVSGWFKTIKRAGHVMTIEAARDCVAELVDEHIRFDRVTVVIRAVQAAFHVNGWFLNVDETLLQTGLIQHRPNKVDPNVYRLLRAYREPARAATVGLHLAGATGSALQATTVDDIAQWRHDPTLPVAEVQVPEQVAPYLRALLLARAADGHQPNDPAFPGNRRRISVDIHHGAQDLALNLGTNYLINKPVSHRRVRATGITIEAL